MNLDPTLNGEFIQNEIEWFGEVLSLRMQAHSEGRQDSFLLDRVHPPELPDGNAPYADVIRHFGMQGPERLILMLAYIPHLKPDILDIFFIRNNSVERRFTEFGGFSGAAHGGFLPTAETAMFLLAGDDIRARLHLHYLFRRDYYLYTRNIVRMHHQHPDEPPLSSALQITPEYLERISTGRSYHPPFSLEFPAQKIITAYDWQDLVLSSQTRQDIRDIVTWVRHENALMQDWKLAKRIKPGFRTLFYGPPGTGKTLTATLLGKETGLDVYRIDLSRLISKYIGETEKNLASLFDYAEHQRWILFFDEADSLFGRRAEARDANDHHANQQIAYLLQRMEDAPGVIILATNQRSHLDEAFSRRFQSMIHFPIPGVEQRLRLWESNFVDKPYPLAPDIDLRRLAQEYELSGGGIVNVLRHSCVQAVVRNPPEIRTSDLLEGIRKELVKEGKFLKHTP
jgi:AAA+ superfamily predicted ATPase